MKAIVTGGAGFIGSHLCKHLLEAGYEVVCIDNLVTGSLDNLADLEAYSGFSFVKFDVTYPLPESLCREADEIYHLASPASPNKKNSKSYYHLPFETMQVNTSGTWHLAETAVKLGAKLLFASTSEVYGDPLEHPQKENYRGNVSTTGPRSVYDEAKRFGETIVYAFVRYRNLDGRIVRIFNTYGPKMPDDGRVVSEFVQKALQGKALPVFGDGTQTRSFCYVDDMVQGIYQAMEKGKRGQIYNLGNPEEYQIIKLAEKIKQLTHSSSPIKLVQKLPEDDPIRRKPDIDKAKKQLGWEPKVSLEQGLQATIKYYQTKAV